MCCLRYIKTNVKNNNSQDVTFSFIYCLLVKSRHIKGNNSIVNLFIAIKYGPVVHRFKIVCCV